MAGLAACWDLARHGAVGSEGQAVPGTGHLQTLSRSEPLGLGEEMAARAGPGQDLGRRPREGSGRKARAGPLGALAAVLREAAGGARVPGQVCVCVRVCTCVRGPGR